MLLIPKGAFRELVGGSDDIFTPPGPARSGPAQATRGCKPRRGWTRAIDAGSLKRIVFEAPAAHVTLGPVAVHLPDPAVLA